MRNLGPEDVVNVAVNTQRSNSSKRRPTFAFARIRCLCVRRDLHFIAIKLATNVGHGTWNGNDHIIRSPASSVTTDAGRH